MEIVGGRGGGVAGGATNPCRCDTLRPRELNDRQRNRDNRIGAVVAVSHRVGVECGISANNKNHRTSMIAKRVK